jgi:RNA polymerase sigma-70 factor (ECF subfamily)
MRMDVEEWYRQHGPMVLRRCRRLLRDEQQALDAMHDVFVEVIRREGSLEVRAPASLLLTTATNVCLNRIRTKRRHPEDRDEQLMHAIASIEETPESHALARRLLRRLFGRVPVSTRTIAVLHYVDRLTLDEVAAERSMSVSGVRKRLRTLRTELKEHEVNDE